MRSFIQRSRRLVCSFVRPHRPPRTNIVVFLDGATDRGPFCVSVKDVGYCGAYYRSMLSQDSERIVLLLLNSKTASQIMEFL